MVHFGGKLNSLLPNSAGSSNNQLLVRFTTLLNIGAHDDLVEDAEHSHYKNLAFIVLEHRMQLAQLRFVERGNQRDQVVINTLT